MGLKLYCYHNGNNYMVLKFSLQTLQNAPRVGLQTAAYIVVLARLSDNDHSKTRDHVIHLRSMIKSSDIT